ncbi:MAG TPA: hypothetical protein VIF60_05565 [Burkholderiaceae bacterium]|jgi:hypothetical protein
MNRFSRNKPVAPTAPESGIVEPMGPPEEIVAPPAPQVERKVLSGYDQIMRRHAAACEGGR